MAAGSISGLTQGWVEHAGVKIAIHLMKGPQEASVRSLTVRLRRMELLEILASSVALTNETVVSEEDARLVAEQVEVHSVINRQETSTGGLGIDVGQQLILQELKTMAKRFGALEEQTAKDREVLTGLVSQVKQQTQGQNQKKVTSLFSPEIVNATNKSTCQSSATK